MSAALRPAQRIHAMRCGCSACAGRRRRSVRDQLRSAAVGFAFGAAPFLPLYLATVSPRFAALIGL